MGGRTIRSVPACISGPRPQDRNEPDHCIQHCVGVLRCPFLYLKGLVLAARGGNAADRLAGHNLFSDANQLRLH